MMLSDVWRLSVAYIGPESRTWRPRKTKIGTEVAHVTHDSNTTVKVKRSKVKVIWGGGIFWRPPAPLVTLLSEIWNVCSSNSSHHRSLNECTYLCSRAFTSLSLTSRKSKTLGERKPRPSPLIPPNSYYWHYCAEVVEFHLKFMDPDRALVQHQNWTVFIPPKNQKNWSTTFWVISRICWISPTHSGINSFKKNHKSEYGFGFGFQNILMTSPLQRYFSDNYFHEIPISSF